MATEQIERKVTSDGSIFFPVDCPWPSPQSEGIKEAAIEEFDVIVRNGKHKYVVLIASSHWCTQGYWIEFKKPLLSVGVEDIVKQFLK